MDREGIPAWRVAAAAFFGGLGILLAWDSMQVRVPEPTPILAQSTGVATGYRALTRAEIMLSAAGQVLN